MKDLSMLKIQDNRRAITNRNVKDGFTMGTGDNPIRNIRRHTTAKELRDEVKKTSVKWVGPYSVLVYEAMFVELVYAGIRDKG